MIFYCGFAFKKTSLAKVKLVVQREKVVFGLETQFIFRKKIKISEGDLIVFFRHIREIRILFSEVEFDRMVFHIAVSGGGYKSKLDASRYAIFRCLMKYIAVCKKIKLSDAQISMKKNASRKKGYYFVDHRKKMHYYPGRVKHKKREQFSKR